MTTSVGAATTRLAVCGAHLRGQPLNPFLLELGARFVTAGSTAPVYRMVALPPAPPLPARPGLIRSGGGGASIEVEVYELPVTALGALMVTVAPPLAVGTLQLDDGTHVLGFVCESYAGRTSPDITVHGAWREYLASLC
jgi:allophanate hydrolase